MESRLVKKKGKHRKYSVEVHNEKYSRLYITKIWNLQYEFADARINCFSDSSTCRDLYVSALLRFFIVKTGYVLFPSLRFYKRYYFCNSSIWILFNIRWRRLEVLYPNSLCHDRSSGSELRYLQVWNWRHSHNSDELQILVTSGGFQGFSRRFLSFGISKIRAFVCTTIFTIISNLNYC